MSLTQQARHAGVAAGLVDAVCLAANTPQLNLQKKPRPRRLEVTFGIRDRREPFGRAGPFRLLERDLDKLIAKVRR
jgi:hypothetical protein